MKIRFLNTRVCLLAISAIFAIGTSISVQAQPRAEDYSIFKKLFEEKIEVVKKTRNTDDDAELIKDMQEAAAAIPDSPEVQRLIYRSMIELGSSSRNYILAASGVDLLNAQFPDDPEASPEKAMALLEKGYRASRRQERKDIGELYVSRLAQKAGKLAGEGDWDGASREYRRARLIARDINSPLFESIQESIDRVDRQIRTDKRIKELQNLLKDDTANPELAIELVRLLVVYQDKPGEALDYVDQTKNSNTIVVVNDIAKSPATLTVDTSLRVAEWYLKEINNSDHDNDIIIQMLNKVVKYCDIALEKQKQRDAKWLRITEMRDDATAQLDTLQRDGVESEHDSSWTDLIQAFDPQQHALGNNIEKKDGQLGTDGTDFILKVSPDAGYDLKLNLAFAEGKTGVAFCLPIGDDFFTLTYSRGQHTVTGLPETQATEDSRFMLRPGQKSELLIRVRSAKDQGVQIQFSINGKTVTNWNGNTKLLQNNTDIQTPEQFGKSIRVTCGGKFFFDKIEYREVEAD